MDLLGKIFETSHWPARWHCGEWTQLHGWIHIISDLAIWGAYLAIPFILILFITRRKDFPFHNVFWLFGAFIFACGTTHWLEAAMFWWPAYRLMGLVKAATALISWATVIALIVALPKLLLVGQVVPFFRQKMQHVRGIRTEVLLMFGIAFFIFIGIVSLMYSSAVQKDENDRWVTHTHTVIESLEHFISHMKDAETGQRGYLITGEKSYLEPYQLATPLVYQDFRLLQKVTRDNKRQQDKLRLIQPLMIERLAFLNRAVELQENQGGEAARLHIRTGEGKALMNQIRSIVSQMIFEEHDLLSRRARDAKRASEQTRYIFILGFLVVLGLIGMAFYLINREMTEREHAQNELYSLNQDLETLVAERTLALKEQLEFTESMTSNLQEGIYRINQNGIITFINPAGEAMLGYQPGALIGKNVHQTLHRHQQDNADHTEENCSLLTACRTGIAVHSFEEAFSMKDGTVFPILCTAAPLRDQDGSIGAVFGFHDISERKQSEKALAEASLKNETLAVERETILNQLTEAVIVTDPDGLVIFINESAERLHGRTALQVLQKDYRKSYHLLTEDGQPYPPDKLPLSRAVLNNEVVLDERWRIVRPDGSEILAIGSARPVWGGNHRKIGAVLTIRDDTARVAAEQALRKSDEEVRNLNKDLEKRVEERTAQLVAINKELEAFSYSVSHDLRSPLRSIDGFSQALIEDYGHSLEASGKDYLQRVRTESQRMGRLIDDMLSLSRLTRNELRKKPVNLSNMVREITDTLQEQDPTRGGVTFNIQSGLIADADEQLIHAVLQNLLSNAWKFTSQHEQAQIEFGMQAESGQSVYYVKDDGAGFNMDYADKLFGAFQRLHAMHEFEGTGIGLATVQRIIHRHGGKVWATGVIEQGSTFYFTLG